MGNCKLGATIAIPGYQSIRVEVESEGFTNTKMYLREILIQMYRTPEAITAIDIWWYTTFGTSIVDDYNG